MTATLTAPRPATAAAPDLAALKTRQQAAWSSGDYAVDRALDLHEVVPARTCARRSRPCGVRPGPWLDVARRQRQCHARGRAPLVRRHLDRLRPGAARRRATHRAKARERARTVKFKQADAEALPFVGNSFDVVVSTFGVMFTANHDKAAAELLRVCRSGGKIGLANWTPDGFIGQLFKTLGKHVPPPAGVKSPALWGMRARIEEMFGTAASSIETLPRKFMFRYRSPEHWMDVFKTYYGPMLKTFAGTLAPAGPAGSCTTTSWR